MTPAPPLPPPAKKGGSLLKNLNPKQKRILAVAGVGALLALIFLMSRSRSAPPAEEEQAGTPSGGQEALGVPPGSGGATDPTAFIGMQSEIIGDRLEEVGAGLGEVGSGLAEVGTGLGAVERGQDALGETFMAGQEADQQEFGRVQAGLAKQSRQLGAIRKQLKNRNGRGGRNKGRGNAKPKPARRKPRPKKPAATRKPPRKKQRTPRRRRRR